MVADVIVVGAGHNGLVAATLLARAGLAVEVLERAEVVGGACRTEAPFGSTPGVRVSSGAYLLGLMPPELIATLGVDLPLVRRDPHYFLPARDGRYLLLGSDRDAARRQFAEFFTEADARADEALRAELAALANDLAPAWLAEPLPVEQTAERYVRPALRDTFVDLVRGSAIDYLSRFGFASEQVVAMYAITDGMPGLTGSPWTPGSGHNMLVHNMCRLPGADGTWMVVRGGMGTVTRTLAQAATAAGATIRTGVTVDEITTAGGAVTGVRARAGAAADERASARGAGAGERVRAGATGDDRRTGEVEYGASAVLVATDPYRLPALLGPACPPALRDRVDGYARRSAGQTMKVNLSLSDLPRFAALPQPRGQHGTTVHLLPEPATDGSVLTAVRQGFAAAAAGRLDPLPPVEWYLHSTLDPSLGDEAGRHSSALFVQGVPHTPAGSDWATEKDGYVRRLLEFVDGYAPGIAGLVQDVYALAPPDIEAHFGITNGNIFHVDNAISFTDRMPYRTGVDGVYAGAAGCFPAGSVIGCAGHNAAHTLLSDLR